MNMALMAAVGSLDVYLREQELRVFPATGIDILFQIGRETSPVPTVYDAPEGAAVERIGLSAKVVRVHWTLPSEQTAVYFDQADALLRNLP